MESWQGAPKDEVSTEATEAAGPLISGSRLHTGKNDNLIEILLLGAILS
jgi:hypothetical protein